MLPVVPYVGTWIEIELRQTNGLILIVVPYVGTWIEISSLIDWSGIIGVVPYVGTWIEIRLDYIGECDVEVVPYVGTWIEIAPYRVVKNHVHRRSLRGNVDRNDYYWPVFSNIGESFPTWERG